MKIAHRLGAPYSLAIVAFFAFAPTVTHADVVVDPGLPVGAPDTYVRHANAQIVNMFPPFLPAPTQIISGAELDAVHSQWTIETKPWGTFTDEVTQQIPADNMVWALFRGKQNTLEGSPVEGVNYAIAHYAVNGLATTTVTTNFDLPLLGDPDTSSGIYTLVIAEIPDTKFVVTEILEVTPDGTQTVEGYDTEYTAQDFINWYAGVDVNGTQPNTMRVVEFIYEAGEAEVPCTEDCFSNVLFLPGIEASRLYQSTVIGDGETKRWEPFGDADVEALYMKTDGTSVNDNIYTKESDVIDELPGLGQNIYKSFIAEMDELVDEEKIADWEAAAYDWRLSLDDILESGNQDGDKISYLEATSTPYIMQTLRELAATSKSGKVTIIAHSNGGLVAKQLTQVLGDEAGDLIDKMIFVAVPQAGAVDALAIAMHGEGFGPLDLAASKKAVRAFASTSPMVYHLLPSANYFTYVDDPVVTFDESLPEWREEYGDVIHSEERLKDFITGTLGKTESYSDVSLPVQLSEALFDDASALHDSLDEWQPPTGVELIQIAGWGVPKTVSGIEYKNTFDFRSNTFVPRHEPLYTIDGDGRVAVPSALWTSADSGATNYWMNLRLYNSNRPLQAAGLNIFEHSRILETQPVLLLLKDYILENPISLSSYQYLTTEAPPATDRRLSFALHSPLTIDLYDSSGNHTGVSTTTGQIEEGIPGTYYMTFGEQKYIFADADNAYQLALDGYDSGTFTLVITELTGDTVNTSITFEDVPVTSDTIVTLSVPSEIGAITTLSVDEDGDGAIDFTVAQDGTITEVVEETDSAPSSSGGGNGPPVGITMTEISSPSTVVPVATTTGTTTVAIATPTTATINATTTSTNAAAKSVKKVILKPKSEPTPKEQVAAPTNTQVASAAQVTNKGLWHRVYSWIIRSATKWF